MSNRFAHLRLLALVATGGSVVSVACEDAPTIVDGTGGSAGSAGSGPNGGNAGSGDVGGSASVGGGNSGGASGSSGSAGSSTGGTGVEPPDSGAPDADGGVVGDSGTVAFNFSVLDFAGASTASVIKNIAAWDIREKFTFGVTGSHTASATVEVANSQATLSFAADDPDLGTTDVFQLVKTPASTGNGDDWLGWAHVIFGLGSALPENLVTALPQWDTANNVMLPGTKVIQLDVYYDDTVDPDFDWETLLAIESVDAGPDIYNSVTAQGYNIVLHLVNYAYGADYESAHDDGGIYVGYSAYLTQPNTWVTLTFTAADEGREGAFYGANSQQVDGIRIEPAGGYDAEDTNPLYMRNLRIVDVP